jgi:hypothetical protein
MLSRFLRSVSALRVVGIAVLARLEEGEEV